MKPNIFVFTGEFYSFDWVGAASWVIDWGDDVCPEVNEKTTFLVAGANPNIYTLRKVKALNRHLNPPIKIIDELEFTEMIDQYVGW